MIRLSTFFTHNLQISKQPSQIHKSPLLLLELCIPQEALEPTNHFTNMSQAQQPEEEVKREDTTTYNFDISQNHSMAQQITLLEITVQNNKTKAMYSNKFTGTAVKKQGFPSNDVGRVEKYVKKAYAGKTSGLTLVIDEKPGKKEEGFVNIIITKDDPDFGATDITLKLNKLKRSESDVLRCVTVRYMSTLYELPPPLSRDPTVFVVTV